MLRARCEWLFVQSSRPNYGGRVVAPQKTMSAVPRRGRIGTDSVMRVANLAKLRLKGSISSARLVVEFVVERLISLPTLDEGADDRESKAGLRRCAADNRQHGCIVEVVLRHGRSTGRRYNGG